MKTYTFEEVLDFVARYPRRMFRIMNNHCGATSANCMMAAFFESQGFGRGFTASASGAFCHSEINENRIVAEVIDFPLSFSQLCDIHISPERGSCDNPLSGYQILANWHALKCNSNHEAN